MDEKQKNEAKLKLKEEAAKTLKQVQAIEDAIGVIDACI